MTRVLLIDDDAVHAERIGILLVQRGLAVTPAADVGEAIKKLRAGARVWEVVILVIGDLSRPWLTILRTLQDAARQAAFTEGPLFLCVSKRKLGTDFQLRIERMGARYACEE
jgi:ActR/RegA family two-component response regulator